MGCNICGGNAPFGFRRPGFRQRGILWVCSEHRSIGEARYNAAMRVGDTDIGEKQVAENKPDMRADNQGDLFD